MNLQQVVEGERFKLERLILVSSTNLDNTILDSNAYKDRFDWNDSAKSNNGLPSRIVHCQEGEAVSEINHSLALGFNPILIINSDAEHTDLLSDINANTNGCSVFTIEYDASDIASLMVNPVGKLFQFWVAAFSEPEFPASLSMPTSDSFIALFNKKYAEYLTEIDQDVVLEVMEAIDMACLQPAKNKEGKLLTSRFWPGLALCKTAAGYKWNGPIVAGYSAPKLRVKNQLVQLTDTTLIENALNKYFGFVQQAQTSNAKMMDFIKFVTLTPLQMEKKLREGISRFCVNLRQQSDPVYLSENKKETNNGLFAISDDINVFKVDVIILRSWLDYKELLVNKDGKEERFTLTDFKEKLTQLTTKTKAPNDMFEIFNEADEQALLVEWEYIKTAKGRNDYIEIKLPKLLDDNCTLNFVESTSDCFKRKLIISARFETPD